MCACVLNAGHGARPCVFHRGPAHDHSPRDLVHPGAQAGLYCGGLLPPGGGGAGAGGPHVRVQLQDGPARGAAAGSAAGVQEVSSCTRQRQSPGSRSRRVRLVSGTRGASSRVQCARSRMGLPRVPAGVSKDVRGKLLLRGGRLVKPTGTTGGAAARVAPPADVRSQRQAKTGQGRAGRGAGSSATNSTSSLTLRQLFPQQSCLGGCTPAQQRGCIGLHAIALEAVLVHTACTSPQQMYRVRLHGAVFAAALRAASACCADLRCCVVVVGRAMLQPVVGTD